MKLNLNDKLIDSIRTIAQKYRIDKIILFGSRARGDNKPTSDIDLAIYPLQEFASEGCFASDIDDLETLLKLDLVFISAYTDKKLLENIEREGVLIYERV